LINMMTGNWNYPTSVKFGAGRIREIASLCQAQNILRPLLVTDSGLASNPMVANTLALLRDNGLQAELFSDLKSNPVAANVEAGVQAYRAGRHDGVVAFGGGSALDVGKVIAFMSGQSRPMWDFEDIGDWWTRADVQGIAPVIAVPTTSGTGSEVGRAGVITDEATHTKKIIFHPKMMPVITLCDPELTVGLPAHLTAATGMDALSHCLEAYCAPGFHPMADGIAVEGMRLVKNALPAAVKNGADISARADMMAAAAMGATAFQKGLGGMHALAHPIGAVFDTHHGLTNAVLMPYVLAFNEPAIAGRIARLANYLDIADGFAGFQRWVLALRAQVGIPHALSALPVDPGKADLIAAMAVDDPSAGGNPVKLDVIATRHIFDAAMAGRC
jgi:alcohol dehydrogenase class IV